MPGKRPCEQFAAVENFQPRGCGMASLTLLGQNVLRLPFRIGSLLGAGSPGTRRSLAGACLQQSGQETHFAKLRFLVKRRKGLAAERRVRLTVRAAAPIIVAMTFAEMANRHLFDVAVYEPGKPIGTVARERALEARRIDKLASNENPLGPSPKALTAMRRAIRAAHIYPDAQAVELRAALARRHGVDSRNIVLGNGSEQILKFLGQAFLARDTEAVMGDRAFATVRIAIQMAGARVVAVPLRNHTHDLPAMLRAITPRTRLVFVVNPNNPTGTRVSNEQIERFLKQLPEHVIAVFDEAYYEYLDEPPQLVQHVKRWDEAQRRSDIANPTLPKVVLLRTFSKIAGLAALRIGYGIAPRDCAQVLERARLPFNTNAIAQAAALAALDDGAFFRRTLKLTKQGREWMQGEFRKLGLEYVPSSANFVIVRVGQGRAMFEALQRHGVIVRPMDGYRMPEWIRVTVGTMPQNRRFLRALRAELRAKRWGCGRDEVVARSE
jgi:histidinol-phosphate aminotransferase